MDKEAYVQEQYDGNYTEGSGWVELGKMRALHCIKTIKTRPMDAPSVLDVGCRNGDALRIFQQGLYGSRVAGVDIVPAFVDAARAVCDDVEVGDAGALPYDDEEFDWCYTHHCLEHTLDIEAAVGELRRVARVGIYATIPIETAAKCAENHSHHHRHESAEEWLPLFTHPDWRLVWLSRDFDCTMVMVKKEYV